MTARLFVALRPPAEVLADLEDFVEPRRDRDDPLSWVPPTHWHVTLAFMPAVADRNLDELNEGLTELAGRRSGFELQLRGAGAFPHPALAKVLWSGVDGDADELGRLAAATRTAVAGAGVPVEGTRFRAHLTLARLRRPTDVTRWLRVLALYDGPTWTVDDLVLMRSEPPQGPHARPRYVPVETFPFTDDTAEHRPSDWRA